MGGTNEYKQPSSAEGRDWPELQVERSRIVSTGLDSVGGRDGKGGKGKGWGVWEEEEEDNNNHSNSKLYRSSDSDCNCNRQDPVQKQRD